MSVKSWVSEPLVRHFSKKGVNAPDTVAKVCSLLYFLREGKINGKDWEVLTVDSGKRVLSSNPKIHDSVLYVSTLKELVDTIPKDVPDFVLVFFHYVLTQINSDECGMFFKRLVNPEEYPFSQEATLNRLIWKISKADFKYGLKWRRLMIVFSRAWNNRMEGEKLSEYVPEHSDRIRNLFGIEMTNLV